MADLVIRGMEMPKKDEILVFDVWHDQMYARSTVNTGTRRYEVVQLPEGHGKLGDLDAIVAEMEKQVTERDKIMELCKRVGDMENYFRCSNNQTEIVSFVRMLNNAPAIVPKEGGGEK